MRFPSATIQPSACLLSLHSLCAACCFGCFTQLQCLCSLLHVSPSSTHVLSFFLWSLLFVSPKLPSTSTCSQLSLTVRFANISLWGVLPIITEKKRCHRSLRFLFRCVLIMWKKKSLKYKTYFMTEAAGYSFSFSVCCKLVGDKISTK